MYQSEFIVLGKVIKAHGLKGEIGVQSYADSPLLYARLKRIYLQLPGCSHLRPYFISSYREHNRLVLLQLESILTRSQAKSCLGLQVYVRKRDLPRKDPQEVYLQELAGFDVFLPSGVRIGTIQQASRQMGQELWSIQDQAGQEVLFPAAEPFVHSLDLENKTAVIEPPPGLLEIYLLDS